MPIYNVPFRKVLWTSVKVEAKDESAAIDLAYESDNLPGGICAQCSGWGRSWYVDEDGWQFIDEAPVTLADEE